MISATTATVGQQQQQHQQQQQEPLATEQAQDQKALPTNTVVRMQIDGKCA
jgi:hypothetical protein